MMLICLLKMTLNTQPIRVNGSENNKLYFLICYRVPGQWSACVTAPPLRKIRDDFEQTEREESVAWFSLICPPDVYLLMRSELINLSSTKYQCWPTQSLFLYSWKLFGRFQFHKVAQPTSPLAHCSGSAHLTSSAITPSVRPGQAVSLGLADWPDVSRPGWASLRWAESDKNVSTLSCYNNQEKVWEEILNLSLDCSLIQSDEGQQISISTWSCLGWAVQIIYLPLPDLKCNFHFPSLVQVGRQAGSHVMSTPW